MSEDVITYLARIFLNKHRWIREKYVITIVSDTPVNETRVKEALRKEFDQQKDDLRFGLRRLMLKLIVLAVLGAAILSLWLYLSVSTESVGVEILSIMGWVCVWEATSIGIMERPAMIRLLKNLKNLTDAEIRFQITDAFHSGESDKTN